MTPEAAARRWHEVVKAALVGTGRGPLPAGPLPGAARADDAEATLLGEAAALGLYRRAAAVAATTDAPAPAPAPDETTPRCTRGAARLLDACLRGDAGELLPEWLALAARAGVRADEVMLPDLLDQGRARTELRPDILRVLGARGRWLAATEPSWRWAVAPASEADWGTGDRAARLALLAELRKRDPARARALVESTWREETAEDRAAFTGALLAGLSDADEPFLEAALDDRRKETRVAAAGLLARLPRSRLAARMADRARAAVTLGRRAEAEPPRACDPAMMRDGVEPSAPRGQGARAFWLRQILSATPLAVWGEPARALTAARGSDWEELLVGSWAVAAARQADAVWAEALLGITRDLEELLAVLAPARREAVVAADRGRLGGAIRELRHPWSEPFSRLVAAELPSLRAGELLAAAVHLHPTVGAELLAARANLPLIELRVALHVELRAKEPSP